MLHKRLVRALGVTLVAVSLSGCADSIDPTSNEIESVAIIGLDRNILRNATSQFEGRAITEGGVRVDGFITWTVSNPGVISVTAQLVPVGDALVNRATVTGLAEGSSDLVATAGAKSATVRIVVSSAPPG